MIDIFISHGKALVWNAEDIMTLRLEHRIVGSLMGCYPRQKFQNSYKYMPLQLSSEEATLLAEKGIAQIVSNNEVLAEPSDKLKERYLSLKNSQCNEQIKKLNEKLLETILENADAICKGKKRKLLEKTNEINPKRNKPGESSEPAEEEEESQPASSEIDESEKKEIVEKEVARRSPLTKENCLTQLFTEFPFKTKEANVPASWCYPKSASEKTRYFVFKDLWDRGYFLTSGTKFGGDFLVYFGDPIKYHALYIIICVQSDQEIRADDLVVYGRLGNQVKKTVVLASGNSPENVEYISLNWASEIMYENVESENVVTEKESENVSEKESENVVKESESVVTENESSV